jgi:hypothetical protein
MISYKGAAYAIASILQGRISIGPSWDKLDKQTVSLLVSKWAREIEQDKESAAKTIVTDLETQPELRSAWASTDPAVRDVVKIGIQELVYAAGSERSTSLAATRKRPAS